jgi:hypothetical protein
VEKTYFISEIVATTFQLQRQQTAHELDSDQHLSRASFYNDNCGVNSYHDYRGVSVQELVSLTGKSEYL